MQELIDLNFILKNCQCILREPFVLVIGAGVSCEIGMPGMDELGEELVPILAKELPDEELAQKLLQNIKTLGLEKALTSVEIDSSGKENIVQHIGSFLYERESEIIKTIINGQYNLPLMKFLQHYPRKLNKIAIITTNYDRLIEYAVDMSGNLVLNRRYIGSFWGKFNIEHKILCSYKINKTPLTQIQLLKVHGSLDWFEKNGNICSFEPQYYDSNVYSRVLVTPGFNKHEKTHKDPYRALISEADRIIRNASCFVCVGFGFNDSDVQEYIEHKIYDMDTRIIIVAKKLTKRVHQWLTDSKTQASIFAFEQEQEQTRCYVKSVQYNMNILVQKELWNLKGFTRTILGE